MHNFTISDAADLDRFYDDLLAAGEALVADEPDVIANMANISALIWQYLPNLNWAGFYRVIEDELVLGPFQGKSACIRIAMGKGVCGEAAITGKTQRVSDVHAFPGHIACDADSRSELVIPIRNSDGVVAVLDLDSPLPDRFTPSDQAGMEAFVTAISHSIV